MTAASVPLPASTITVVREAADGFEVLMMQRSHRSTFVPGAYLFPGGGVDASDHDIEAQHQCSGLDDQQASRILNLERGGLAFFIAVLRELFEEAGLLLAYDNDGRLVQFNDAQSRQRWEQHRLALNNGERTLTEILKSENLKLAVDKVIYFAHWITPVRETKRYDTRFFMCAAPEGQVPLHDDSELIAHAWMRSAQVLESYHSGAIKMHFPTETTLNEFAGYTSLPALTAGLRAKREIPTWLPRITRRGGRLLPGDAGYDEPDDDEIEAAHAQRNNTDNA